MTGSVLISKDHATSSFEIPFRTSNMFFKPVTGTARDLSLNVTISHLYNLAHFADRGLVKAPFFVQSVFGLLGGIGGHPEDVLHMKRTADRLFGTDYRWSVLGAGANQFRIAAQSAALGGNVRVGLEDSLWAGKGELATSNAVQAEKVQKIIEGLDYRRNARRGACHP